MTDEMKPCPFCGGTKIDIANIADMRRVACRGCGAKIERYEHYPTAAALSAWNARAPAQSAGGGEPMAARVEELVKRLRDAYAPQKFGVLPHRLIYKEAADLLETLSARAFLTAQENKIV